MTEPVRRRGVTVVVPVFDDLPTIERCLRSVLDHLGPHDDLIVINDAGPAADAVGELVQPLLEGRSRMRYLRNERNLGFVETCNRAAALDDSGNDLLLLNSDTIVSGGFVDELSAVLHASPLHGVVCPRSNNATIASIPYYRRHPSAARTVARATAVHAALAPELPRFAVTPVAMGFCFLVRRELIDEHGLFDVAFSPGYGEENDFCLRMNARGHLALIANRVFVAHVGGTSFRGRRGRALRAAHEQRLNRRYPFYPDAVATYLQRDLDVVDRFADALLPTDDGVKVLLDESLWRGDRHRRKALLEAAAEHSGPRVSITVVAPAWQVGPLRRRFPRLEVRRRRHPDELYDVAVLLASGARARDLPTTHRRALRWLGVVDRVAASTSWRERVREPLVRPVAVTIAAQATRTLADAAAAERMPSSLGRGADVVADLDPSTVLAAAVDLARVPVDLDRLRAREGQIAVMASAFGRDRLGRTPLAVRIRRQLEWLAPGLLVLGRRLLGRHR